MFALAEGVAQGKEDAKAKSSHTLIYTELTVNRIGGLPNFIFLKKEEVTVQLNTNTRIVARIHMETWLLTRMQLEDEVFTYKSEAKSTSMSPPPPVLM